MTNPDTRRPGDPAPARRGEQTGKRDSEQRNDPEAQPGAREGKPDRDGEPASSCGLDAER